MTPIQQSLRLLALPAALLLCFLYASDVAAQNKVTFSLQNRQTSAGVYTAELWATVSAGSSWQPGNCIITVDYNHSALSMESFDGVALLDPDAALNGGGYMAMYQSLYDNILSVNIINLSGSFATKTGSFRIGTLRWTILNGFLQDSLRFETQGNGASIVGDGWNTMDFNCGGSTCYGITNPTPAQTGNPPVITQQPQSDAVCLGTSTSLSVAATSVLAYRWEKLNNSTWEAIAGATSSTLSFSNFSADHAGSYRIVLSGNAPPVATSQTVILTLQTAAAIVSHPADSTVCEGSDAVFTADFSGDPAPVVMWEVSLDAGATWSSIAGATGATLSLQSVSVSMNGNQYRARAINLCNSATTDPAALVVQSGPVISAQSSSAVATAGSTVSLSVTAAGSGLVYRWQKNSVDIPGADAAILALADVQLSDIGLYRAIVSGVCGGADTSEQIPLIVQTVDTTRTTLVVRALMQGYWNGTAHVRTPVSVELRSGQVLLTSTLVALNTGILQTNGTITLDFADIQSGSYWIVVRHGGYLPVASAAPVQVTRGTAVNYDFSDAASKAYQNGTIAVSAGGQTYYVLKGGDLNGNRAVNPQDLPLFLSGYPKTNAATIPGL